MTCLRNMITLIGACVFSYEVALAQDQVAYCAFEVTVRSPRGEAIAGAAVSELGMDGKMIGSGITDGQGVVKLCDAPVGLVDIQVGGNRCGAVKVSYLKAYWLQTRRLPITYENCSGEEWAVPGGCLFTIRLRDQQNSPIAGVLFDDPNERPAPQTKASDTFGRIFRFIKFGETMSGRLHKNGYLPQDVSQKCQRGGTPERESIVVLRDAKGDSSPPK
jgi:hypothetical protein